VPFNSTVKTSLQRHNIRYVAFKFLHNNNNNTCINFLNVEIYAIFEHFMLESGCFTDCPSWAVATHPTYIQQMKDSIYAIVYFLIYQKALPVSIAYVNCGQLCRN